MNAVDPPAEGVNGQAERKEACKASRGGREGRVTHEHGANCEAQRQTRSVTDDQCTLDLAPSLNVNPGLPESGGNVSRTFRSSGSGCKSLLHRSNARHMPSLRHSTRIVITQCSSSGLRQSARATNLRDHHKLLRTLQNTTRRICARECRFVPCH